MIPSNDLFDLIKSLSKSEKRYFRLYSARNARGEPNKYERLFELVERQEEYDEEEIRRELGDDPMARHLPAAKNYLHGAIMRALDAYHMERSVPAQIATMIHQAEILYRKKLYAQYAKLVARAKEMAMRHDQWHLAIDIIWQEYVLMMLEGKAAGVEKQVDGLMEELRGALQKLRNQNDVRIIQARLFAFVSAHEHARTPEQLAHLQEMFGGTFGRSADAALTPSAKLYHEMNHALYGHATSDPHLTMESYGRVMAIIDATPELQTPRTLIPTLNNICNLSIKLLDERAFFEHHARLMRLVDTDSEKEGYKSYVAALNLLVQWHARNGEFDKAMEAHAAVERAASEFEGKLRVGFDEMITFEGFHINFAVGDYRRAIDYLNRMLDRPNAAISPVGFACAKLFMLIAHLELGNYELLEYLVPSTTRTLRARGKAYETEELLLRFMRRMLNARSEEEERAITAELQSEVAPLLDHPFEKSMTRWIDLAAWIESRLGGESYAEVVRRKADGVTARSRPPSPYSGSPPASPSAATR